MRFRERTHLKLKFFAVMVSLGAFIFGLPTLSVHCQTEKAVVPPTHGAARPADVASRDAIVAALYDSISGAAGERDWDRFRSLFISEAQLIAAHKTKDGDLKCKVMTVQGYVDSAGKYFKEHAFYEREISRKIESFGSITHIFSTYESRDTADGKPFERGINSIQLFDDGSRLWIVDVYWTGETPENAIPARYLSKNTQ
jgi:hypothetical protein